MINLKGVKISCPKEFAYFALVAKFSSILGDSKGGEVKQEINIAGVDSNCIDN